MHKNYCEQEIELGNMFIVFVNTINNVVVEEGSHREYIELEKEGEIEEC